MINPETDIAAVILCGGKGSRMGGVDKGLQYFKNAPLALTALLRLQPQVAEVMLNANRNIGVYEGFGVPVVCDTYPDYPGPLAGFHAGLVNTNLPYLMTVPCDVPAFPLNLVEQMAQAFKDEPIDLAVASV
ncbi:MAG: molybdenum cofactor guanylyltransferase, partial [Limnobacter sp.]|nr:molybdenum cofactor guanylyltransferase [Limnobacter sp.]